MVHAIHYYLKAGWRIFQIKELKSSQVVIMDNASFHKSKKTKELIESVNCKIIFLPPYSPDLNPIEKF
ncbi:IS630 family transposase domain protein [Rickettsiales endosymbiont of Paramecium tredecaurelia]|uniref:transposase n=1 Tax=Candidatus Sarmatiella mevalonica TaxID=2770581 RepID=UPI001FC7C82F|nr:transposase [Candidatus Sarmatiella mevalonica]MBL3284348.1 IS630 family transposase domain protein [Candidatus Sarmatiella mevalonica]